MDRGAWWSTVHEVAQSQTRLSDLAARAASKHRSDTAIEQRWVGPSRELTRPGGAGQVLPGQQGLMVASEDGLRPGPRRCPQLSVTVSHRGRWKKSEGPL